MAFQLRAALGFQALPVVFGRNADIAVVGRLRVLIRHLEEDQVGELLQIVAIADAVIAQRVAEAPDFGNDGCGVHAASFPLAFIAICLLLGFDPVEKHEAGSSLGSCATRWPEKAFSRMLCRSARDLASCWSI